MLVFADVDSNNPRFDLKQIETALLALPIDLFRAASRFGVSDQDGLTMARMVIADELRRRLIAVAEHRVKES